ncbi:hypothetical protein V6Z11_A04G145400 [Gossypium hirsutum]
MFFPVSGHHSTVEISQKFFGYLQVRGLPKEIQESVAFAQ